MIRVECLLSAAGVETGKAVLRDYINATIGFRELGGLTDKSPKSLMRMFGPNGNPQGSPEPVQDHRLPSATRGSSPQGPGVSPSGELEQTEGVPKSGRRVNGSATQLRGIRRRSGFRSLRKKCPTPAAPVKKS